MNIKCRPVRETMWYSEINPEVEPRVTKWEYSLEN